MPHHQSSLLLVTALLAVGACGGEPARPQLEKRTLTLQREWIPNAEFAGEALAVSSAAKEGVTLIIKPGSAGMSVIDEVRSGRAEIGVASADQIMVAAAQGAPLVVIGSATTETPVAWLARGSDRLGGAIDFARKRVAVQAGTNTEMVTQWLIQMNNTPNVSVRDPGWGAYEDLLRTKGESDIVAVFAYDEPVFLSVRKGFRGNLLTARAAGLSLLGTVYFTRRGLVDTLGMELSTFLKSVDAGWSAAKLDPSGAIAAVKRLGADSSFDVTKETASLKVGLPYFPTDSGGARLRVARDLWSETGRMVASIRGISAPIYESLVDTTLWVRAFAKGTP